jgi:hypothetical protein
MKTWTKLLAAIAGAILLAAFAITTPAPAPADAPATAFSATRAMEDVREIARAPHPTGSAESARVVAYLAQRLRSLGMEVTTSSGPISEDARKHLDSWRGSEAPAPDAVNLIATLPGRDPGKPAVLLMAHHDSVWGSPGAADDAAGVAAILETVRAIRASGAQPERTLMVLFTDAEELGLDGAKHFFAQEAVRAQVGVIVNLEARGGGGRASMFETGNANGAMIDLLARSVSRPVGTSLSVFVYNMMPNSTDYTVAKRQGVPGFNFGFAGRPGLYHSPLATPNALDQGSLQDIGRQALDLARGLLAAPELPGPAPDRVFYDLFGLVLLAYAGWIGWLILAVAVAAYAYAGRGVTTLRELGRGAGATLALIAVSGLFLFLGNLASGADGKVNYYDRLAAIPRLEVQALLLCLAALALIAALLLHRRALAGLMPAVAAPLLLLAVLAQATAPTAAFPLQIPLLLGGIGAGAMRWRGEAAGGWVAVGAAAVGGGYLLTLGHLLFQAVGPDMPFVMVLPLILGAPLLLPLFPRVERPRAMIAAGALGTLALAIALWVRFDAVAASAAVYSTFH